MTEYILSKLLSVTLTRIMTAVSIQYGIETENNNATLTF